MVEGEDRDSVVRLQHETMCGVVDQHDILQSTVYRSKIFDIVTFLQGAMLTVQPMRKDFVVWVEVLEDNVCVLCAACSEYYDLGHV